MYRPSDRIAKSVSVHVWFLVSLKFVFWYNFGLFGGVLRQCPDSYTETSAKTGTRNTAWPYDVVVGAFQHGNELPNTTRRSCFMI